MKHILFLSLCFLCFVAVATAQTNDETHQSIKTGNDLRQHCRFLFDDRNTPTDPFNGQTLSAYCAGYLDSAIFAERLWQAVDNIRVRDGEMKMSAKIPHFCFPSEVTNGQLYLVIQKWMDEHPEELHESALLIIRLALIKAFPCK